MDMTPGHVRSHIQSETQEIELQLEDAKERIAMDEAVDRLLDNADFKKVVTEGYFKEEVIRAGLLVSDPNLDDRQRATVQRALEGIGSFQYYLQKLQILGSHARGALEEYEEELAEAQASMPTYVTGATTSNVEAFE